MSPPKEVPAFARSFPAEVRLDVLVQAFEEGNYRKVRRDAPELARSSEDPAVKAAAEELVRRTKPDPLMVWLLVLTAILLATLSAYWVSQAPHVHA